MWRKGNSFALLVGIHTGAATVEGSMEIPQKIKNGPVFWLNNPNSETISKGIQNTNPKEHKHPCVHCSVIYNRQAMEGALKCPLIDEWIKQLWDNYTVEYYLAIKKKNLPFVIVWMDLENIMLSEISQSEKDKYHTISLRCGI